MKDLFEYLVRERVTPNGLFVLYSTHNNIMVPNYVSVVTEQRRLVLSGHLKEEDASPNLGKIYALTDKGLHVLRETEHVMSLFKMSKKKDIPFGEWEEKIKEYLSCFPAGKQNNVPIRCNPKTVFDKFKWFFLTFPEYTWDDVMAATRAYIQTMSDAPDGFKYITCSKYFVKKEDRNKGTTSLLADWCQAVLEGNVEDVVGVRKRYYGTEVV